MRRRGRSSLHTDALGPACPSPVSRPLSQSPVFPRARWPWSAESAENSSANAPRPEPRTSAIFGRSFVCDRMNFAAFCALSNSLSTVSALPLPIFDGCRSLVPPLCLAPGNFAFFALTTKFPRWTRTSDWPWFLRALRERQIWPIAGAVLVPARRFRQSESRWN